MEVFIQTIWQSLFHQLKEVDKTKTNSLPQTFSNIQIPVVSKNALDTFNPIYDRGH